MSDIVGLITATENNRKYWRMSDRNQNENKWKKAMFGAALGMFTSAVLAIFLYLLSGQGLYLAIIGLGMGIGFSVGGGLDTSISFD